MGTHAGNRRISVKHRSQPFALADRAVKVAALVALAIAIVVVGFFVLKHST